MGLPALSQAPARRAASRAERLAVGVGLGAWGSAGAGVAAALDGAGRVAEGSAVWATLTSVSVSVGEALYGAVQASDAAVQGQLSEGSVGVTTVAVVFAAGLATSLSPCVVSMLPLTVGYLGGYEKGRTRAESVGTSLAFAGGLATTLAGLGVAAGAAGKAYGQVGPGLPILVSLGAVAMGLNLLGVLQVGNPLEALGGGGGDVKVTTVGGEEEAADLLTVAGVQRLASVRGLPKQAEGYLLGLVFGLAASPCSTPVLATLLGYAALQQEPAEGAVLLLAYTTGYSVPVALAGIWAGSVSRFLAVRKYSQFVPTVSGTLLVAGGLYSLLDRIFPATAPSAVLSLSGG